VKKTQTDEYYLIDVNYFPSLKNIDNLASIFQIELILKMNISK